MWEAVRSPKSWKMSISMKIQFSTHCLTLAEIAQNHVILPEMGSLGILGHLHTRNRYQKSFRSYFKAFWNFRFFFLTFYLWVTKMKNAKFTVWDAKSSRKCKKHVRIHVNSFPYQKRSLSRPHCAPNLFFVFWPLYCQNGHF